jgi:hypothetical protein
VATAQRQRQQQGERAARRELGRQHSAPVERQQSPPERVPPPPRSPEVVAFEARLQSSNSESLRRYRHREADYRYQEFQEYSTLPAGQTGTRVRRLDGPAARKVRLAPAAYARPHGCLSSLETIGRHAGAQDAVDLSDVPSARC